MFCLIWASACICAFECDLQVGAFQQSARLRTVLKQGLSFCCALKPAGLLQKCKPGIDFMPKAFSAALTLSFSTGADR